MSPSPILLYAHIASQLFISAFDAILLFVALSKICKPEIKDKPIKIVSSILIVYLVFVSIARGIDGFRLIFYGLNDFHDTISSILIIIRLTLEIPASLLWYFMIAYQLNYVFKDSTFKIQRCTFIIQGVLFITFSICIAMDISFYVLQYHLYFDISLAIAVLIYVCGYYHMIYLFNRKLYLMIHQRNNTENKSTESPLEMKIITRATVLVTIHAILTFLYIASIMINAFTGDKDVALLMIYWFCTALWYSYNALCIFLMLRFNESCYGSLCKACDSGLKSVCNRLIRRFQPQLELDLKRVRSISIASTSSPQLDK